MTFEQFSKQDTATISDALFTCCSSEKWTALLLKQIPLSSSRNLVANATSIWYDECTEEDWLEAFSHHPRIGDMESLKEKFASTGHLAAGEQSAVANTSEEILASLTRANKEYEEKFGFIFIVCATGKSAPEMLRLLTDRLGNTQHEELSVAMGEQYKITIIRLKKLLKEEDWGWIRNSQLTTHVLDTATGRPGEGVTIRLQEPNRNNWQTIAQGVTNADGRISELLPPEKILSPGNFKLVFETGSYFKKNGTSVFYPRVEVQFNIADDQHYHIPLLLNPFGYSTYRGS
jgi:5-hydroxyisourate hydrolase/2-oxo-4-hydroxy-4-carboxy-5-ureidoimidazoline decarboxylase